MNVREQLQKEIEGLPVDTQRKILKLVHFVKKEMLLPPRVKPARRLNPPTDFQQLDDIAIETGLTDLADQHDHYLYGTPKK